MMQNNQYKTFILFIYRCIYFTNHKNIDIFYLISGITSIYFLMVVAQLNFLKYQLII